jgi:hypothetical protein
MRKVKEKHWKVFVEVVRKIRRLCCYRLGVFFFFDNKKGLMLSCYRYLLNDSPSFSCFEVLYDIPSLEFKSF